jgi:hypothetical protein
MSPTDLADHLTRWASQNFRLADAPAVIIGAADAATGDPVSPGAAPSA